MQPDQPPPHSFEASKSINEALSAALVRYAGLMGAAFGQDAIDGLALVRQETLTAAQQAGMGKEQLQQLAQLFERAALNGVRPGGRRQ